MTLLGSASEIKVIRHLCNNPFSHFSMAGLVKEAGISHAWAYKIAKRLNQEGILEEAGKKIKLDYSLLFCKRLKLLFDAEQLETLNAGLNGSIFKIADKVAYEMSPSSIILVGSVALGKHTEKSDIDFLVVSDKKEAPYFENYNLVSLTKEEFKDKYLKGDDFVVSALLFGKIVFDNNFFINFFESPLPIFSKEIIQEKIRFCEKLEERIYALLKIGDEKAGEELFYLALQSARILLLKNKIVPRTKNEIANQVRPFNKQLSDTIQKLQKGNVSKVNALIYIKVCMENVR